MANEDTNVDVDTSESDGKNTDITTGADNQTAKTDDKKKDTGKSFTQDDVNSIIRTKQAEWKGKYQKEFEKTLEGKTVLTEDELKALRTNIETEVRTAITLQNKRAEYKARGLTDEQLDAVSIEKPEEYDARVEKLFGALLKKTAPVIKTGTNSKDVSDEDDEIGKALKDLVSRTKR